MAVSRSAGAVVGWRTARGSRRRSRVPHRSPTRSREAYAPPIPGSSRLRSRRAGRGRSTGPIDGLPFFCTLGRPDLVCGAGFSGNGVGPSVLGGRILASMALGFDDEWAHCGLVRSPPSGPAARAAPLLRRPRGPRGGGAQGARRGWRSAPGPDRSCARGIGAGGTRAAPVTSPAIKHRRE